jgi:hypothetical protein
VDDGARFPIGGALRIHRTPSVAPGLVRCQLKSMASMEARCGVASIATGGHGREWDPTQTSGGTGSNQPMEWGGCILYTQYNQLQNSLTIYVYVCVRVLQPLQKTKTGEKDDNVDSPRPRGWRAAQAQSHGSAMEACASQWHSKMRPAIAKTT